jgi:hypothetical protein
MQGASPPAAGQRQAVFGDIAADRSSSNLARVSSAFQQLGWKKVDDTFRRLLNANDIYPPDTRSGTVLLINVEARHVIEVGEYLCRGWNFFHSSRSRGKEVETGRLADAITCANQAGDPALFAKAAQPLG